MRYWNRFSASGQPASRLLVAVAVTIAVPFLVILVHGTQAQSVRNLPKAKYTDGGPEACLTCHGGPQMTVISKTPHGDADNPHTPYAQQGCESCHGPGSFHVSSARGGKGFPPLNDFKHVGWPKQGQFDQCLGCHAQTSGNRLGIGWVGSQHDTSGMTCSTCHDMHSNENPLADVSQQQFLCASCHGLQNSKHEGFERNGIKLETLKCSTCHDPHQL